MADENDKPAGVPLGAQILRKLHGGLSALSAEVTKMAGQLDACEAKDAIGGLVGGIGSAVEEIGKHWGKFYKDHDIAAAEEEPAETKAEGTDDDDRAAAAALDQITGEGDKPKDDERQIKADDDDDEAAMTPDEKRLALDRIKKLEAEIRHRERLQRQAAAV